MNQEIEFSDGGREKLDPRLERFVKAVERGGGNELAEEVKKASVEERKAWTVKRIMSRLGEVMRYLMGGENN